MPVRDLLEDEKDPIVKLLYSPPGCFVWLLTWVTLFAIAFVKFWMPHFHGLANLIFPGMPVIFGSLILSYPIAIPLIYLFRGLLWLLARMKRALSRGNVCATCGRQVRPYAGPGPGRWTGSVETFAALPQIDASNAFRCEACESLICPLCAGNRASGLAVKMFVCSECDYRPLNTIYRR